MERYIEKLIDQLDSGEVGRREFCQTVALAATVYAAGGAEANAAPAHGFKLLGLNHLSYQCPDYTKARDFYASTFGMDVTNDKGNGRANLAFGPGYEQGGQFLVVHNPPRNPPKPSEAVIDHICYTIANWDESKVRTALKAKGFDKPTGRDGSLHITDPFGYDLQIGNDVQENAFRRGQG